MNEQISCTLAGCGGRCGICSPGVVSENPARIPDDAEQVREIAARIYATLDWRGDIASALTVAREILDSVNKPAGQAHRSERDWVPLREHILVQQREAFKRGLRSGIATNMNGDRYGVAEMDNLAMTAYPAERSEAPSSSPVSAPSGPTTIDLAPSARTPLETLTTRFNTVFAFWHDAHAEWQVRADALRCVEEDCRWEGWGETLNAAVAALCRIEAGETPWGVCNDCGKPIDGVTEPASLTHCSLCIHARNAEHLRARAVHSEQARPQDVAVDAPSGAQEGALPPATSDAEGVHWCEWKVDLEPCSVCGKLQGQSGAGGRDDG